MGRSCDVEIVTGFLGWGKTSFIESYLDITSKWDDNTIILQLENGRNQYDDEKLKKKNISVKRFKSLEQLDEKRFNRIMNFYEPKRIIIELNCMVSINNIISKLKNFNLTRKIKIVDSIAIVDVMTVQIFMKNMSLIVQPNIMSADLIILNNCGKVSKKQKDEVRSMIESLNKHAHIIENKYKGEYEELRGSSLIRSVWR
ncbi:MAG: GTP-binding protein [Inconstantimicrobium porci]|uniref:GTP-binding protein n=1 Tax=Inconstantimicrobium porci TaxID=2652291 RepID=UPI002A91B93E|nr:GTP-binding protein [Inconstantimicrobium porci]MDY5912650.1 GTP-binding protein [Inconstantimicrobium porci]